MAQSSSVGDCIPTIECEIANGAHQGKRVHIPKIKLNKKTRA